ncbi:MAG: hypothetical protein LRS49_05980 [Desulfurococcales archaeon]|nr:hypothetical protein [Desulfurococcales archaeon]
MRPLYGQGFFNVCAGGVIWYTIVFDYEDREALYSRLLRDPRLAGEEVATLRANMQRFLDEERILVNGSETRARVLHVYIDTRGERRRATAVFTVEIPFRPRPGRNVYEDYYEPERAEYPYTVTWTLPPCASIVSYEMPGRASMPSPSVLEVRVDAGARIRGYESLVFDLSNCQPHHTPHPHP